MSTLAQFGTVDVEKLLTLARIAETAERYEDMCEYTSELVKQKCGAGKFLSVEERNLLSVAFKNVVGAKRASWRTLNGEADEVDEALLDKYKKFVEDELEAKCKEILDLLEKHLLPSVKEQKNEGEVFYLKMCADYYRYLAEFVQGNEDYPTSAETNYKKAMEVAQSALPETHPTRLGLALNFSVCYYEILKKPNLACDLAKKAFDDAIQSLDNLDDTNYKDSTLIMQLLRDNLTLWTSEANDEES
jgi:14-3-3 protein epsilon